VYHDNDACPHGREIKSNNNDKPGTDRRRRCDWCATHADRSQALPIGAPKA
jgi:hypothetical protein